MKTHSEQSNPYVRGPRADYTWSAHFALEEPLELEDIVTRKLGSIVADYAHADWPLSGAVLGSNGDHYRNAVVLGLDPSRSFGTPTVERCEKMATKITSVLGWERQPEELPAMRVILGRCRGYDGPEYSMEHVQDIVAARGATELTFTEADLFSLRFVVGLRQYIEPGVIIEGSAGFLDDVLHIARDMGQERLVTEVMDVETQAWLRPQH